MTNEVQLRAVIDEDLPIFYQQQLDPQANHMAAFTADDPSDQAAFAAHWTKIRGNPRITIRTILFEGQVAGHIAGFEREGEPEITYWLGKEFWGRGIATRALTLYLEEQRPALLYARAAKDNLASVRVLEKCGFHVVREERGFASARGQEIEELVLERRA